MQPVAADLSDPHAGDDRFRLIADSAPVPMWVTRRDRTRSFVNRAYVDFLAIDYARAVTFDWRSILHPEDAARVLAESIAGEASLQPFALEARYRRHDGAWRWLHSISQPSFDVNGAHAGFIGVAHDVTEAKDAATVLREREAQFSAFVNQSTAGFAQVDLAGRFTLVNDRFCAITGRSREALLGLRMQEITHPDDLPRNLPLFEAAVRDGTPYVHDKRYIRPDGSIIWVNNSVSVIRRADGEPYGILAVTLDITERRRTDQALRESEWRFRTIFEQANDYIFTSDLAQRITSCNPAVCHALGYTQDEAIGRSFADFVGVEQFAQTSAMLQHKLDHGGTTRHSVTVRTREGRPLIWEVNSRLIDGPDGRPSGLHAIARDVTEAKAAEEHQALLINELNHRVKNTLAIVQSMARQSFRGEEGVSAALGAFEGRLGALATAHDLLTRDHWTPAPMRELIRQTIAPHAGGERVSFAGPELMLAPKTAITLTLAIHELAVNATKHGALSVAQGTVVIAWSTGGEGADARFRLEWIECGGPAVRTPGRRGFGTRMIERGLAAELGGTVAIDFAAEGLRCSVDAPLPGFAL